MQLLTAKIFLLIVFVIEEIHTELNPAGQNVCLKPEPYEEKVNVKVLKPVPVTERKWCWSIKSSFKCTRRYNTWKEVTEVRVVNRTRIVPKCCDGYKEEREYEYQSTVKCSPVCLKGCKNGVCVGPEICDCFSGFYGSECEKGCSEGHWGKNCDNTCDCSNNGKCDKVTGVCYCEKGWMGDRCESPCQTGYHGYMCKLKCDCGDCNHQTGECFTTTTTTTTTEIPTTEPEVYTTEESVATETQSSDIPNEDFISEILKMSERVSEPTNSLTELTDEEITTTTDVVNLTTTSTLAIGGKFSETTLNLSSDTTETTGKTSTNGVDDINEEIEVTKKINKNFNIPINIINETREINLSGSEQETDKLETDNFIRENKGNKKTMVKILNFLPGLSVFSSVSILTFIVAAFWLINKHRRKTKLVLENPVKKKNKSFQQEEQIKNQSENFFWSTNCTNNPVYLSDVDVNRTIPVLETFKPLKSDKNGVNMEKEIR